MGSGTVEVYLAVWACQRRPLCPAIVPSLRDVFSAVMVERHGRATAQPAGTGRGRRRAHVVAAGFIRVTPYLPLTAICICIGRDSCDSCPETGCAFNKRMGDRGIYFTGGGALCTRLIATNIARTKFDFPDRTRPLMAKHIPYTTTFLLPGRKDRPSRRSRSSRTATVLVFGPLASTADLFRVREVVHLLRYTPLNQQFESDAARELEPERVGGVLDEFRRCRTVRIQIAQSPRSLVRVLVLASVSPWAKGGRLDLGFGLATSAEALAHHISTSP